MTLVGRNIHLVPTRTPRDTFHLTKLLKGLSNPAWNTCRDGAHAASLDKLYQVPSHSAVWHVPTHSVIHLPHHLMTTSAYAPDLIFTVLTHCQMHLHLLQLLVQKTQAPKSTGVSDNTTPCSAQSCCRGVLTETFAEAILEKQSIDAFISLGNEKTKLPIMTKFLFFPEKLWHRRRKLMFAAHPQKHLRLLLLLAKSQHRRICAQCNHLPFREHKIRRQNTCTTTFLKCWVVVIVWQAQLPRGRGQRFPAFLWDMSLLGSKREWKL